MKRTPEPPIALPPLFCPKSLARYLTIHISQIRGFRRSRRLPPPDLMIGNRPRWKPETIASVVDNGRL
jgi:hypothetical protein